MNYLAHFHLSHGNNDLLIGALLGDFIKGPLTGKHGKNLEQGILLHRKIDAYTDTHPQLITLHQSFQPHYRRYASIMTDVAFDHFLNKHWQLFHNQSLDIFSQEVFTLLDDFEDMPKDAKILAGNLSRYNAFKLYQHWPTIEQVLTRISARLKHTNPLATAADELYIHYPEIEKVFLDFYPQLQQHVSTIRQTFTA